MKKVLSLFLTVVMVLSMFSCLTVVSFAATSDLVVGQEYTVASETTLTFIPEESGSYKFESFGYGDPKITINCQNGEYSFDDDNDLDFCGTVDLEEGEEVSCYLYNYDDEDCVFTITKIATPTVTFNPVEPLVITESTNGYWDCSEYWDDEIEDWVWVDYYYYYTPDGFYAEGNTFTVEYPDGTSDVYTCDDMGDYVNSSGDWLDYSYDSNQSAENYWTLGSDNYFFVELLGKKVKIPVTIAENPCESIEFIPVEPFVVMENMGGYTVTEETWDETTEEWVEKDYYKYSVWDFISVEGNKIVVNYNDGTSDSYTYREYYFEGEDYYDWEFVNESGERLNYDYLSNQAYDNQWTIGSDNYFTVTAFGKEVDVYVTITENPYESIEFVPAKPLEIIENTNGYWDEDWYWDEDDNEVSVEYYRYSVSDLVRAEGNKIAVKHKDGTIEDFFYDYDADDFVNASGKSIGYWDYYNEQSYDEQWTLGSDNYFTFEALGKQIPVYVTIVESPYESIEFIPAEPFEIVENTNGYLSEDCYWDEDDNEVWVEYYRYDAGYLFYRYGNTIVVNYKDGTSDSYTYQECYNVDEDYYYDAFVNASGEELDCDYSSNQGYHNQWTLGSDNYFIVEAFGKEVYVPVTIIENPYESIEFIPVKPLYFEQYTNGYWDTEYNEETGEEEEFFYYSAYELIETYGNIIRLNKKDGTTEDYEYYWWGFENSDGETLDYSFRSNSYYWEVGSDNNYITISANGVECTVYVTITAESTTIQEDSFVAEKVSEDSCIITEVIESDDFDGTLDIPETVDGCEVVGIDDGVLGNVEGLKTVNLPASFNMISEYTFNWCDDLEAVNVSADNAVFASVNGVLYNKALTEILYCPQNFKGVFVIKAGVTDIPSNALVGLGNASAVEVEDGNTAFAFEDGILYNSDFTKIYKAFDVEGDYVMKPTVEEVADYAFSGIDTIESVAFSSGVTEISYAAFSGCTALESVDLPDALVSIGIDAFSENTKLSSVTLPASTRYVYENAFRNCSSLKVINLNNGIEFIGVDAFNSTAVEKINLPDSLQEMAKGSFRYNKNLSDVTIGSGLRAIPYYAFFSCTALKNIDIPENIQWLGYGCFAGTGLTSISLHDGIDDIEGAFYGCDDLKTAYLGSGIQYMADAFAGCINLESVELADGFEGKGMYAFSGCEKLEGIELPETVTEISYGQFKGCKNIDDIDLPDDLLVVEAHSFDNTGLYNNHANGVVYVDHVAYSYKGTMPANYDLVIKEGIKSIAESAFENKTNLVSVQFPTTLEYVGDFAFFDCTNLTTIYGVEGTYAEEYAAENGYEFVAIEGHIHTPSDWIIDKNANCTEAGSKHKECTDCGETLETATILAKGHTEVKDAAVAATCTQTGKTEGSHCSVCNAVIVAQQTVAAKGHTASALKYNEVTRTEYKECTVCKEVLESKQVPLNTTKITSCYNEVKGVQLKWNAVSDATSYKIYRKLPSQTAWTLIRTETGLAYQDTNVAGNTIYQYKVKAVDQYGNESDYSAQRECRFIETPELLSRESAVGGVKITWEKVAGATSYRIYRRGAGTDYWYYLGDASATQNTFFDPESSLVSTGNYYRYTVRASYDGKDSSGKDYLIYSGFDTNGLYLKYIATPKLTSISNATNGLQVKWSAVYGAGRMEYRVYRRGAGSTYWKYLGTTTSTTWTDSEVKNASGAYYRYTVRAVQGTNGNGWYSAFDTTGLYLKRLANPTLTSAVSSNAGITVKWSAVNGTTGYYVYRKTANSSWVRIAAVGGTNNTTYIDKTAKKGTTYTYTVRAVYGATTSYFNPGISCKDKY